ncbi:MAG: response regulator [Candidatus Latescibacterota bacterium]|nr:response regulator [Candidatus Latescibacterota bacterium]
MQDRQELIDIQAVADSFGKSVESIRKYKNFGIIRVSDKRGNKDLFDREEIMSIRDRLRELRLKGLSLAQIADELDLARDEHLSLPSPPMSMSGQTPNHEPGQPLKILVVDDEDEVRAGLREFLEGMDYAICEAADGAEALAKTFTEKPHMILLDLRLPKVDGYQVCQTLKGNPITSGIPIIMLTALNATPNKIKGIEFGADDYVDKPFDLDELAARIKMVTRRMGIEA